MKNMRPFNVLITNILWIIDLCQPNEQQLVIYWITICKYPCTTSYCSFKCRLNFLCVDITNDMYQSYNYKYFQCLRTRFNFKLSGCFASLELIMKASLGNCQTNFSPETKYKIITSGLIVQNYISRGLLTKYQPTSAWKRWSSNHSAFCHHISDT